MQEAFYGCTNLEVIATDPPDLTYVTDMSYMFAGADVFNQPIGNWDTSKVTDISYMFAGADNFNQDISGWNTVEVTTMEGMFSAAEDFNQPLNSWDVSSVTTLAGMFANATAFDQPLNAWDTSNVTSTRTMFAAAFAFNQDLSGWDVSSLTDGYWMFFSTPISTANYDALLISWNAQTLQNGVTFGDGPTYCLAESARQNIIDSNGWTITDGGKDCSTIKPVIIGPVDGHSTTDHTPNFDWEDFTGASRYVIQVSPDADFTRKPIIRTVTNSFFAPGVSMINQSYYWRVVAIVDGTLTDWSEVRTITITGSPGNTAPVALSPDHGAITSDHTPTFDWTDVDTATRYRIHISLTPDFGTWLVNQTVAESEFTPSVWMNSGTYWWRVQAEGNGDSSWFSVKHELTID